jgi:hypothetical protein
VTDVPRAAKAAGQVWARYLGHFEKGCDNRFGDRYDLVRVAAGIAANIVHPRLAGR